MLEQVPQAARPRRRCEAAAEAAPLRRRRRQETAPAEEELSAVRAKKEAVRLMGQKVHPGGMRVGVHDWKSNWYTGKKEVADYILEDVKIREHIHGWRTRGSRTS